MVVGQNPFSDFFETDAFGRQAAFGGMLPMGGTFNQENFFRNLYQPVFTDYLGAIGRAGMQGTKPPDFTEFLQGMDLSQRFRDAPMSATGTGTRGITSSGRFFYGR